MAIQLAKFLGLSALIGLFITPSVSAADHAAPLIGLRKLDVVVEGIGSNDCSITADDLSVSLRYVLSQSKLRIDSSSFDFIYLNVNVMDDCHAVSVDLSVKPQVQIIDSKRSSPAPFGAQGASWKVTQTA